jgi:DHA2 family multidrug resistance protein
MTPAADLPAEPPPLGGIRLALGALALAMANFVVVLDMSIANVSIPHIAGGLAASSSQATWAITSYAVADAITVPLTGWLALRYGSVRWFIASLVGFGVASVLCGLATTLPMLIGFRIVQGLAGGPLMPLSQALLMRIFPKERAGAGFAIWAMTTTAAPIFGPLLGGLISDSWSWRWIFLLNVPVVALCVIGGLRLLPNFETDKVRRQVDLVGLGLLVLWVGAFQLMLDTGREHDWFESSWITTLAIVAAIGFASFLIWEATAADPMVDVRIFRHRGFALSSIAIALCFGAFFAQVVLTPLWLQQVIGFTASNAAHVVAWVGLLAILFSPLAARLSERVDLRLTISLAMLWFCAMSLLRARWTPGVDYWSLALPHLLQGAAMPFVFIGLTALAMGSVARDEIVSAAGIMSFVRTLSTAVGVALATSAWGDATIVARSDIVATIGQGGSWATRIQGAGLSLEQGRLALDGMVEVQAATIAVLQIYSSAAFVFALGAALIWLAARPQRS